MYFRQTLAQQPGNQKGQINNGNTLPKITRNASQKVTSGWTSTKGKKNGHSNSRPIFAINV